MTVDGTVYKTKVSLKFARCLRPTSKKSCVAVEYTGCGPLIIFDAKIATISNPNLKEETHWRDLHLTCEIFDDGTDFKISQFYFGRLGDKATDLHAENILRGLVRYFTVLYDCPGFRLPNMLSWGLITKARTIEKRNEALLLEYQRNAEMKPHVMKVLSLKGVDCWYALL